MAQTIAEHTRKGDQLVVIGRIGNNDWLDSERRERYGFNFLVEEFGFGAPGRESREALAMRTGNAVDTADRKE